VALTNRSEHADLSRAKKHLGYEPQFPLQAAVKDQAAWMRRYMG
jgi:nucleoside-diphosphate-sugar epimerase